MALSYGTTLRNAKLDAIETTVGTAPLLKTYSGSVPANAGASLGAATLLVTKTLPSDWAANASGGSKAKSGTWSGTAVGTGTPTFFRVYDSSGTTCHIQGTAGVGSGDLSYDGTITSGQTVSVSGFTLTDGNP